MNKQFLKLLIIIFATGFIACSENDPDEQITEKPDYSFTKGVFVLNEGNFMQGNGSVSFCPAGSNKVTNDIFYAANQKPTGDVIQSMLICGSEAWVVANNSGKIEIVNLKDFKQISTIIGLTSPRHLLMVNKTKIYLSDVYKPELKVIDISTKSVVKTVKCTKTIEKMLLLDGRVFMLNWSAYGGYTNNTLMVADTSTDLITNTVQLSKEPNSLVADKNGKLWILCSGGFLHEEKARLFCMNPVDLSIVAEFAFNNQLASPSQLCLNKTNDTLFFLDKHVFRMAITDANLPQQPIVNGDNKLFYALGVSPDNSMVYVSDAIDYQQKGTVYVYNSTGRELYSFKAGIIPGAFVFN